METLPVKGHSFPPSLRLHLKGEFDRVFQEGGKTALPDVVLWHRSRGDSGSPRMSVVVSKRLGTAVRRNRVKRLIRECFRLGRPRIKPGLDLIIYPRPAHCGWKRLEDASRSLEKAWRRAGLIAS